MRSGGSCVSLRRGPPCLRIDVGRGQTFMAVPKYRPVSLLNVSRLWRTGRRQRWTEDEKLRIVAESLSGARQGSSTARRHGISRSLLMTCPSAVPGTACAWYGSGIGVRAGVGRPGEPRQQSSDAVVDPNGRSLCRATGGSSLMPVSTWRHWHGFSIYCRGDDSGSVRCRNWYSTLRTASDKTHILATRMITRHAHSPSSPRLRRAASRLY